MTLLGWVTHIKEPPTFLSVYSHGVTLPDLKCGGLRVPGPPGRNPPQVLLPPASLLPAAPPVHLCPFPWYHQALPAPGGTRKQMAVSRLHPTPKFLVDVALGEPHAAWGSG